MSNAEFHNHPHQELQEFIASQQPHPVYEALTSSDVEITMRHSLLGTMRTKYQRLVHTFPYLDDPEILLSADPKPDPPKRLTTEEAIDLQKELAKEEDRLEEIFADHKLPSMQRLSTMPIEDLIEKTYQDKKIMQALGAQNQEIFVKEFQSIRSFEGVLRSYWHINGCGTCPFCAAARNGPLVQNLKTHQRNVVEVASLFGELGLQDDALEVAQMSLLPSFEALALAKALESSPRPQTQLVDRLNTILNDPNYRTFNKDTEQAIAHYVHRASAVQPFHNTGRKLNQAIAFGASATFALSNVPLYGNSDLNYALLRPDLVEYGQTTARSGLFDLGRLAIYNQYQPEYPNLPISVPFSVLRGVAASKL